MVMGTHEKEGEKNSYFTERKIGKKNKKGEQFKYRGVR
jgi:hypothetical protein